MKVGRVVVVDEAAGDRRALIDVIQEDGDLRVVGEAAAPDEAALIVAAEKPDLATVDIHLPELRGLDAIDGIMIRCPTPILAVTAQAGTTRGELIFQAVRRGALDVAPKPKNRSEAMALREQIRRLSTVKVKARKSGSGPVPAFTGPIAEPLHFPARRVVGIASSAGGPKAVATVLGGLLPGFPAAVIVVQHLPSGFAAPFARFLKGATALRVVLADKPMLLEPSVVYVAPDDRPLAATVGERLVPLDTPQQRPADLLFRSLGDHFGAAAIGVILSGIGDDGAEGLLALRARGGLTIAQDEGTSAVYGMPRAAREAGAAEKVLPLHAIAVLLTKVA